MARIVQTPQHTEVPIIPAVGDKALTTRRSMIKNVGRGVVTATAAMSMNTKPALALIGESGLCVAGESAPVSCICSMSHHMSFTRTHNSDRIALPCLSLATFFVLLAFPYAEDIMKPGTCPKYEEVKSSTVNDFDVDKYMGIWYEQAYHDWTQIEICGCTRFNMTRRGNEIEDKFTTKCPYIADAGLTYALPMNMIYDEMRPGQMVEVAFSSEWPNMVLDVWKSRGPDGEVRYEKAIQMQCVPTAGRRGFVGVNFLSRKPIISKVELNEMFAHASALGLEPYGGSRQEMVVVRHEGCSYPSSTDETVIYKPDQRGINPGASLGVKIVDASLLVRP